MKSPNFYSKDHPVVAFVALLLFFVFLDFYMSAIPTAGKLKQYLLAIKTLKSFLPEGQKFYLMAMESLSNALYQANTLQVKDPLAFLVKGGSLSLLLGSWASKYILALGAVYAFIYKLGILTLLFPITLLSFFVYSNLQRLLPIFNLIKAFFLSPIKDWKAIQLVSLHLANPVPASISHHNPMEGGLLSHSLRVARIALRLGKGMDKKMLVYASLLHDVGKMKLYRKEKFQSVSAPSPLVVKPKLSKGERWVSLDVNQKVVNFVTIREVSKRFGIPEIPGDVWSVVGKADGEAVEEELKQNLFNVEPYIKDVLGELEYIKPKKDGWRVGPYVFVLAHAFNRRLTQRLLMADPLLPLSPEPASGIHIIAYSLCADKNIPLVWEIDGKRADELGLFNLRVKGTLFEGVYCFDLTKINLDIPQQVKESEVEVIERGDRPKRKEAVGGEEERGDRVLASSPQAEGSD